MILTPKCTLVPSDFYDDNCAGEYLAQVVDTRPEDEIKSVSLPQYGAVLVWAQPRGAQGLPEIYRLLEAAPTLPQYNKIVCSWEEGYLYLVIAQGKSLLLANTYKAEDFTTAQYYVFLAMKSLQLNPEVSTISWMTKLGTEETVSLYRYFKGVEIL